MHEPFMKAGSRGSSILGSILLLALAGSAAVSLEPFFSTPSDQKQLAASSLALVEDASIPTQTSAGQETATQSDSLAPGTVVDFRDQVYSVYYACKQETREKSNVNQLIQTCQPGFSYSIFENDGVISVSPFPISGGASCPSNAPTRAGTCSNPSSPNPVLSCWSGQPPAGTIWYTMSGEKLQSAGGCIAGKPIDVAKSRLTGLQKTLDAAPPEERPEILQTAGVDAATHNTLMNAFTNIKSGEEEVAGIRAEVDSYDEQIRAYGDCTNPANPCTAELNTLVARRDDKLRELQIAESELTALKNNAVRIAAGEPPSNVSTVPDGSGNVPPQLSSRGTTGFNGGGLIGSPEAQPSIRDSSYLTSLQEGIADSALSFNDMVKSVLGGAIPAATRVGGAVALSSGGNPYLIAGGLLVGTTCYYYCPGVVESIPETLSPEARQERASEWTSSIEKAGTRVLGGIYTGYSTVRDWWYGPSTTVPPASTAQDMTDRGFVPTNVAGRAPSITTMPPIAGSLGATDRNFVPALSLLRGAAPTVTYFDVPGGTTDRGFVPTNVVGGAPSIFRLPPTSGRLGIEDRNFVPASSLFPGTAPEVTYLDVPGGTTDRGFVPTIVSRGIETSPVSVPVESASPRVFGPLPFQPLASQNQAGFGGEINFSNAYTPQGVASLLLTPITGADRTVSPLDTRFDVIAPVAPDARAVAVTGSTVVPVPFSRVNPVSDNVIVPAFSNIPSVQPVPDERASIGSSLFLRPVVTGESATPVSDTSVRAVPADTVVPVLSANGANTAPFTPLRPQNVYTEPLIVLTDRAVAVRADAAVPAVSNTRTMGVADSIAVPIPFSRASPLSNNVIISAFPGAFPAQPISDERIAPVSVSPERLPLGSQNQAGFGEAIDFGQGGSQTRVRTSLVPQIKGSILTVPSIETEEQPDTGGAGGTGNPPNPPGSNEPPNPPKTGIGWKWPIIGTGVGAGTCWLWWCSSTETTPSPVKTPPPRSTNDDSKPVTGQPDIITPAETGTKKPATTLPEQPQNEPRIPNTGITYPEDHYCVTNIQPLTVYIIPKGTPFPTNCYNNPYQTTPTSNYPPPGYAQTPARPSGPSNVGQSLGQALQRFITGDARNEREETSVTAPRPISATSTPTTTPQLVPALLLVANPSSVAAGQHTKLSWASVFTRTCSIADPSGIQLVENGSSSDSIITPALSVTTVFTVLCSTVNATSTVSASTTVTVR